MAQLAEKKKKGDDVRSKKMAIGDQVQDVDRSEERQFRITVYEICIQCVSKELLLLFSFIQ